MSFESILVRILNRRATTSKDDIPGFRLGMAETLIGNTRADCILPFKPTQHTFVCGRTGSGKTTLLLRLMDEHIRTAVPFLFIDFHGHATQYLLAMHAAAREKRDVVLFEPWSDPILGWNPLESNGQSSYELVQELVGIFHRRLWPDAWGPRLEELLRMTLLALAETSLTLLEATSFISKPAFRRAVLQKVSLAEVREFWALRFERLSPSQRSLVSETVLNKLSVFHDPAVKYVVGQVGNSMDFDRALGNGQTIIANLSGALLVAKLKSAVYHRAPTSGPYSIFLDEFQEMVAIDALDDYLRSFRKFNCSVFLATQHLQLSPELRAAIFGNCARFFSFATSAGDASLLGREFGGAESNLIVDILPELETGQAISKMRGQPATLLRVTAPAAKPTPLLIERGRAICLGLGKTRAHVEQEIEKRAARFSFADTTDTEQSKPIEKDAQDDSVLPEGY
jgi:hypothetical protein